MSFEPVAVVPSPLPPGSSDGRLNILALPDLHLPKSTSAFLLSNRDYLDRMDYAVLLGDMVSCYGTDREYREVNRFVSEVGMPYTAVSGNHEWFFRVFDDDTGLYGDVWTEGSLTEQRKNLSRFQTFYGLDPLWRAWSHALGHFVFLSLDGAGSGKQESLSAGQREFLHGELEAAGDRPLFVFCHAPVMLDAPLDMIYYDHERTGCVELMGDLKARLEGRQAPTLWISGHVHLRPDHYLFPPYKAGGNVWQIHCPDGWGYGRWVREQNVPKRYPGLYTRHLEIDAAGVDLVAHDHRERVDTGRYRIDF